jgi:hypothetical protein
MCLYMKDLSQSPLAELIVGLNLGLVIASILLHFVITQMLRKISKQIG